MVFLLQMALESEKIYEFLDLWISYKRYQTLLRLGIWEGWYQESNNQQSSFSPI